MDKIDFKKLYKEFYLPKNQPSIIEIPPTNYLAVRGKGNPNTEDGEYKTSINLLYGIAYTLKMSHRNNHQIAGFFDYVVPPLEGLWWQEGKTGNIDYHDKNALNFISIIRLPDFVTPADFDWAIQEATKKSNKASLKSSSYLMMKVYASSACISVVTTKNQPPSN